jgi:hypothetical protein
MRWLASEARKVHTKFLNAPPALTSYVEVDEMETYETSKLKPLSIALAVRHKTGHIIGAEVATMNCHGKMAALSRNVYGIRADTRARAFLDVLQSVQKVARPQVTIGTDGKWAYNALINKVIPGAIHAPHVRAKGQKKTGTSVPTQKPWDPLYRLNQTAAKLRADISRLARRTWSASKRATRLQDHLAIYIAFNNGYAL